MRCMIYEQLENKFDGIPFTTFCREHCAGDLGRDVKNLPHMHKAVETLLVLDGKAEFYSDGVLYKIKKGDIVFVPPYTVHNATVFDSCAFSHICLCFQMDLINDKELFHSLENGVLTVTPLIRGEKYANCIKNAYKAHREKRNGWRLACIGNMSLFFSYLEADGFITSPKAVAESTRCKKIFGYITDNYAKSILTSDIADLLHMNESYFCRFFKKSFGCPFGEYLNLYRLEKSKNRLKSTDMPVTEISHGVGFNSFSYYSKKFKEYTGVTPSEYRKKNKGTEK